MDFKYHCIKCGKTYNKISQACQHDPYYNYLEIFYNYDRIKKLKFSERVEELYKLLPLKNPEEKVILGEGKTPLFQIFCHNNSFGNNKVYVKNESQNPTGSFKDRESSVVVSRAKELGHKNITVVSSGNAALSAAAYANRAKLKCASFIPSSTSKTKKLTLKLLGCQFKFIDGDYETIYRSIIDNPLKNSYNVTSGKNVNREEGSKFISFEIWENLKSVPDMIIIPIGNGTLLSSIYKGFWELKEVGFVKKIPQLIGVQVKNASPIAKALKQGKDFVALKKAPHSVAEGIIARESYDSPKAVRAIKNSKGKLIEVSEGEIVRALRKIIKEESLIPEPTSAVVYAALEKMKLNIKKQKNLKIVCIHTGNGIKNIDELLDILKIV